MAVSPRLPGRLQMLEKHPQVVSASERPRTEECLPRDVLERMLACLDRESLCTARLVSKTFCAAASAHVCSLTLASTSQAVSLLRYPRVGHVTVTHVYPSSVYYHPCHVRYEEEESMAQLDPRLRDLATALTVKVGHGTISHAQDYLSQAALMPKLRKLEVEGHVEHEAAMLARCTNLEAISLGSCDISVARTILTLRQLTSICIDGMRDDDQVPSGDDSWLEHATNLRSLQALSIIPSDRALPLIGNLTGLTGLTVLVAAEDPTYSIAPHTRLTRLKALCIGELITESNLSIACSLGSSALVSLELLPYDDASADCGRYLSRQTALTRLSVYEELCNLPHIGALRIELLQCLEIHDLHVLDAAGLSVLCRATSLTKLYVLARMTEPQMGLSNVLAQLTQLRSLTWHGYNAPDILDFPSALSPLTGLTKLKITSIHLYDGDLRALLGLTGLRKLELIFCRLTDAAVRELAVLTNLNTLKLVCCGVASLAHVTEVLDPLREARGWPPMNTTCQLER